MHLTPKPKNTVYCGGECLQTLGYAIWNDEKEYFCINFIPDPTSHGALPGVAFYNKHFNHTHVEPLVVYVHFTQEKQPGTYGDTRVQHLALVSDDAPRFCYENEYED